VSHTYICIQTDGQTDGRTDDLRQQYAPAYVHRAVKSIQVRKDLASYHRNFSSEEGLLCFWATAALNWTMTYNCFCIHAARNSANNSSDRITHRVFVEAMLGLDLDAFYVLTSAMSFICDFYCAMHIMQSAVYCYHDQYVCLSVCL